MKFSHRLADFRMCLKGKLRAHRLESARAPIFVVGTGRSGTHWLGHILESHPALKVTVERQPMFGWSKSMALNATLEAELMPRLVERYRLAQAASLPLRYADKSHPNLWFTSTLAQHFPGARFIGVQRGVHAVVASMLRHSGVLRSIEHWQTFPVPNRFLGITSDNRLAYKNLSVVERCTLRWLAHRDELLRLKQQHPGDFLLLDYELLMQDTTQQLIVLQEFLGEDQPFPETAVKTTSLNKWRDQLSERQIAQIDRCCADFNGPKLD